MIAPLSSERWKVLEPLIDRALDLPREQWPALLDDACAGDIPLRLEVQRLLLEHRATDTLFEHPAAHRFASLLGVVSVRPPEVINGNYRVERKIGQGGMATVYLAHDVRHDRKVAVKVLHPELSAAFRAEQFLAEIRTMARLQHPHILQLHDSGEVDGLLFYVMPYVEGESLRQRIDRATRLDAGDVTRIVREVASALDYAHRHDVIHRDIKPENILLGEGGALVADFGIALAISTASAREVSQPGWIAGTPRYMSPEQMSGSASIDGRCDVYALGVVAYEMLAGQPPFAGITVGSVDSDAAEGASMAVAPGPPSLRQLRSDVPRAADAVVDRAVTRRPAERFPTGGDFASALERSLTPRSTRRSVALVAAAIVAITMVIAGARLGGRAGLASAAPGSSSIPGGRHQTKNLAAYDFYQRGRDQLYARSDSGQRVAIAYFQQAIAADSTYAAAYAELAHMYALQVWQGGGPRAATDAEAAARKAIALDDSLSDAHAELGFLDMFARYDLTAAGAELQRAVALDPASGRAHDYLGYYYCWVSRPADAVTEARRAAELDPMSVENRATLVGALYCDGRYDAALALIDTLRQVQPPIGRLSGLAAAVYRSKGMWREAIAELGGKDGEPVGLLAATLADAGDRASATRILHKLIALDRQYPVSAFDVAVAYEGLGEYDSVFVWLDKAIDQHGFGFWDVMWAPRYARLRADPRFERIKQRLITPPTAQ